MPQIMCVIVLLAITFSTASAQTTPPPPNPVQQAANAAFNNRDWPKVVEGYTALIRADTTLAQSYMRLAIALTALGRYSEAKEQLAIAERRGTAPPQNAFRRALIDAGEGRLDSAFARLKQATDAGLPIVPNPGDSFPQMQVIKRDARYAKFVTDLDRNARPCMHDKKYNEFDFWLGTWDVRPRGQIGGPAGRNVITKIENGCVVHEFWRTAAGGGQSYNIWDATRQKWLQFWVDQGGGVNEYSGEFRDGAMRYEGHMPASTSIPARQIQRVTFTPLGPDSMRQLGEVLRADGTWVPSYDLIYTRVPGAR